MKCLILCLILTTSLITDSECRPSFWDAVPGISQVKYLFLYTIGEEQEAEQTWDNFTNLTHLWESVKDVDNSIPGYGHVKSIIVAFNGDQEQAREIFKTAQKSTFMLGGFLLAGPVGAAGGLLIADTAISVAEQKPAGIIEHAINFPNKTSGENFDVLMDLTLMAKSTHALKSISKTLTGQHLQSRVNLRMKRVKQNAQKIHSEINKKNNQANTQSTKPKTNTKSL